MNMETNKKSPQALWLWILVGTAVAFVAVALLIGLGTGAQTTAQEKQTVEQDCQLVQTIHYTRCGHEITRRLAADKEYAGATLSQMQEAFADWSITSYAPSEIVMSCSLPLYCPEHLVVMPDGAGVLGVYYNEYGDAYALKKQLEVPISDLAEEMLETIHLGLPFATMQEIESWLETLES